MLLPSPHRFIVLAIWSLPRALLIGAIAVLAVLLDSVFPLHLSVLAMPTGALGTAIALFLGFKNNQAYERFWEGRTLWGAIVNTSRTFAAATVSFVRSDELDEDALAAIRRELVLRHLAWANALRLALRRQTDWDAVLGPLLSPEELADAKSRANVPNRILCIQSARIEQLVELGVVSGTARHLELRKLIRSMWDQQGGCERIKATPLLPHYTTAATIFVWIFIALLPFALMDVANADVKWVIVPIALLIGWVYDTTDRLGQITADPFDGARADVPMTAICRTIEIDLRALLGDPPLPPIAPRGFVLD